MLTDNRSTRKSETKKKRRCLDRERRVPSEVTEQFLREPSIIPSCSKNLHRVRRKSETKLERTIRNNILDHWVLSSRPYPRSYNDGTLTAHSNHRKRSCSRCRSELQSARFTVRCELQNFSIVGVLRRIVETISSLLLDACNTFSFVRVTLDTNDVFLAYKFSQCFVHFIGKVSYRVEFFSSRVTKETTHPRVEPRASTSS